MASSSDSSSFRFLFQANYGYKYRNFHFKIFILKKGFWAIDCGEFGEKFSLSLCAALNVLELRYAEST